METVAVVGFLVAAIVVVLALGAVGYFLLRSRGGEGVHLNQRILLRAYLYLGTLAGLILLAVGVSGLVQAGLGAGLGYDFSYYPQYVSFPRPIRAPVEPGVATAPDISSAEEQRQAHSEGLDRAYKEGLLNGMSYVLVGAIIWGIHVFGRRRLTYTTEVDSTLQRAYLLLVVLIFGIITLVNLPQGMFEALRFYILEPIDEFSPGNPPGDNIAWAIVALPIWLSYLFGLIRDVRQQQSG